MAYQNDKNSITIPREKVSASGGMVILPLKEYQRLCERAVPTYYLKGKAAEKLDKLVGEGLREYRQGKTIEADSLKDALRVYGRKKNKKN